jgi:hypothetical protein
MGTPGRQSNQSFGTLGDERFIQSGWGNISRLNETFNRLDRARAMITAGKNGFSNSIVVLISRFQ